MIGAILLIAVEVYVIGILSMTDIWMVCVPIRHRGFVTNLWSVAWRMIAWPFYLPFLLAWSFSKKRIPRFWCGYHKHGTCWRILSLPTVTRYGFLPRMLFWCVLTVTGIAVATAAIIYSVIVYF